MPANVLDSTIETLNLADKGLSGGISRAVSARRPAGEPLYGVWLGPTSGSQRPDLLILGGNGSD
jgi:hypothetical protein